MATLQPIEQQAFADATAHRVALGVQGRHGYHQVRASLITVNRQRRRAQRADQQVAPGEQFAAYPAQVPGQISGHRECGEHPLAGR
jgi:hypothetical protein